MAEFYIRNTTKTRTPSLPFKTLATKVLGASYRLSLVFAGDHRTKHLNQTYRKRSYIPNVLAFPLSKTEGEIFINPNRARVEAKRRDTSTRVYIAFLFIHALLHLKGYRHGSSMEKEERRLLRYVRVRKLS